MARPLYRPRCQHRARKRAGGFALLPYAYAAGKRRAASAGRGNARPRVSAPFQPVRLSIRHRFFWILALMVWFLFL
jgi:hypothetical protein